MTHDEMTHALTHLRPGAEWHLRGLELIWLDKNHPQPTTEELNAACHSCNPVKMEYEKLSTAEEKLAFLAKQLGL